MKTLAQKPNGMTRNEIVDTCQISSGGTLTLLLEELMQSGFVSEYSPFNKTSKDNIYKLSDEFSLFYIKFMNNSKAFGQGTWQSKAAGNAWKTWCGLAFESICLKHVPQIKKALGISGVYSEQSAWRHVAKGASEQGAQIDLLIDRQDNCINLCEIKFSLSEYELDKKTAENLDQKRRTFLAQSKTKKSVFITMLTTFGVQENSHYFATAHNQLRMDVLFEKL